MSGDIKVAIAGVGNCCSSLIQGIFYYKDVTNNNDTVPGLMHNVLGGYSLSHIRGGTSRRPYSPSRTARGSSRRKFQAWASR